jgi:sigma-B regulation protein RsbU (phosphoserine phosphatase)
VNMDLPAVLLVDDRSENLLALEAVLEPLPCRLVAVTSGEEALKALLQDEFAVVLLDVQMPGMDGFETAELIKGRERTRAVPIIFVTAINKERDHVFRGYSAGAVDYVFKPYDPGVLRSKVSVFLELDAKSRAAAHSEAMLRAAFDAAPIGKARVDLDGRIAEVNRAFATLVGRDPADLRDRLLDSLVHRDEAGADAERRTALLKGRLERYDHETRLVTGDGEEIPCTLSFSLARPGSGIPDAVIVQVVDLRERKRAEAEREQLIREQAARAQAEQITERLVAVQRISDAALGSLAFDDLVRELLTRTVEVLHADTAAIVLHDGQPEAIVYEVAGGVDAGMQQRRWALGSDPAQAILGEAEPVALLEAGAQQGGPAHPLGPSVASVLAVPLRVETESIGALYVGTLFPRRFSEEDAAMLAVAADRAGLAIQRVRLFEREHAIAEELQRSLLPAELPTVEGVSTAARYLPAGAGSQVGGDWYDVVVQPDGKLLLVIGDVAGRGIVAASRMGQLRAALRAYAFDGHGPASVLERLNAFHVGLRERGMATVGLISVDPETGELRYAKAGHPPALLVSPEGEPTWLDEAIGVPLGAIDDATYEEGTATLAPGSTLVLYTDGLVELRGELLDRGFERLERSTIGAPDDVDALCDAVLEGTLADPDVDDDVTLLVLRMTPVPVVAV